jgi:hypothetical protein
MLSVGRWAFFQTKRYQNGGLAEGNRCQRRLKISIICSRSRGSTEPCRLRGISVLQKAFPEPNSLGPETKWQTQMVGATTKSRLESR